MKLSTSITIVLALLATPIAAQSASQLKRELKGLEKQAKKDPDALYNAGKWAKEVHLEKDATRIFKKVLKLDKDHVGAHTALGNEQVEGKWISSEKAKKMREAARMAEYKAKGFKKIDDIWVPPDQVGDARKGVFHHDGKKVARFEKVAFQDGKVPHPVTGQFINANDLEKANKGYYPLGDGKWGDEKQADKYHSDISRPWFIRSAYATIASTLPIAKINALRSYVDQGHEKVAPLFGGRELTPAKRPLVMIAKTQAEYSEYGQAFGDGTDVAGAFLMTNEDGAEFAIRGQGPVRPAICENHKDWGTRNIRHAAALGYVNSIAEEAGADLPLWFMHGVGSYTSRFENNSDAGWFGKQHVAKGGVSSVKSFFKTFALNGGMESTKIAFNLFQAGLLLSFATQGGNTEVTDAMVAVTDALSGKGKTNAGKAITKLEGLLAKNQDEIIAHMNKLIAQAPKAR